MTSLDEEDILSVSSVPMTLREFVQRGHPVTARIGADIRLIYIEGIGRCPAEVLDLEGSIEPLQPWIWTRPGIEAIRGTRGPEWMARARPFGRYMDLHEFMSGRDVTVEGTFPRSEMIGEVDEDGLWFWGVKRLVVAHATVEAIR